MIPGGASAFSVLLPVYARDRADHLVDAFRSVVDQQSVRPSEVVVVVDGPIGARLREAVDAIRASPLTTVTVVRLPENRGLAHALNAGLDAAAHDIVARMDADDLSREDRFEVQLPWMHRGFDLVGSALHEFRIVGGQMRILGKRTPPLDEEGIRRRLPFADPFNHPTVVFRRDAVRAAGGYRPLGRMEDYWLFARMVMGGATTMNVADALVRYRVDSGSYARRGGVAVLRSELAMQRALRELRVTTRTQRVRNIIVRGGYRLIPVGLRRVLYRRVVTRGFAEV